jgi:hypothetical protein
LTALALLALAAQHLDLGLPLGKARLQLGPVGAAILDVGGQRRGLESGLRELFVRAFDRGALGRRGA